MIATCQFCSQIIVGPEVVSRSIATSESEREAIETKRRNFEYKQLSMLVSAHMSERHEREAGAEVMTAMALAGAAVAARFVCSSDPAFDSAREAAGRALVAAFEPKPPGPVISLVSDVVTRHSRYGNDRNTRRRFAESGESQITSV